jgi:hypothetical protein
LLKRVRSGKVTIGWIKQQLLVIMSKSAASLIEVPTPEQKTQQQNHRRQDQAKLQKTASSLNTTAFEASKFKRSSRMTVRSIESPPTKTNSPQLLDHHFTQEYVFGRLTREYQRKGVQVE